MPTAPVRCVLHPFALRTDAVTIPPLRASHGRHRRGERNDSIEGAAPRPVTVPGHTAPREAASPLRGRPPAAGLPTLAHMRRVLLLAVGHSRSMLAERFFAHESRDGTQMAERVRRLYPPLGGSWSVGENL